MKVYLILFFWCIGMNSFGQTTRTTDNNPFFTTENIKFNSAGVMLDGTLFRAKHSFAAVVLVHGSGQEIRIVKMASILAQNGITVLTYDKRGVGKSEGVYAGPEVGTNNIDSANLNLLALDASNACKTLLAKLPGRHGPLGLLGGSQAGWVIPLAAAKNSNVNFMVLFSGPVVTTLEQLRFQFYTAGNSDFWNTHTEDDAREHIKNDPDKYKFAPTDPYDALARVSIPGLWIFGGRDIQAPVGLSIERLNALKENGKPYEYKLYPELGHNTAFSKSNDPVDFAIKWIKTIGERTKRK